jgi:hypothetical protein
LDVAAPFDGTAATPKSVELFWQHPTTQTLEMTFYRGGLVAFAPGRRLFVKHADAKLYQQTDFIVRLNQCRAT